MDERNRACQPLSAHARLQVRKTITNGFGGGGVPLQGGGVLEAGALSRIDG